MLLKGFPDEESVGAVEILLLGVIWFSVLCSEKQDFNG